jgi:hypothetical protein
MRRLLLVLVFVHLATAAAGCSPSGKGTTLVVTVDSDLEVGREIDAVDVVVADGAPIFSFKLGSGGGRQGLPVRAALVPRDRNDKTFRVEAVGRFGGTPVVSQAANATFVPGTVQELVLFLGRRCLPSSMAPQCPPGRTCEAGDCVGEGTVGRRGPYMGDGGLPRDSGGDDGSTSDGAGGGGGAGTGGISGSGGAGTGGRGGAGAGGTMGTGGAGGRGGSGGGGGTGGATGSGGAAGRAGTGGAGGGTPCEPGILLLLDRSLSMNDPTAAGSSRWNLVIPALRQVLDTTEDMADWGIKVFPESDAVCTATGAVTVPIAAGAAAAVSAFLGLEVPGGASTPMDTAITAAASYVRTLPAARPRNNYLLLVSDGTTNCAGTTEVTSEQARSAATQAVQNAASAGIHTFVLGVDTAASASVTAFMNDLAVAGMEPLQTTTRFYTGSTQAELVSALRTIVYAAWGCGG